jgi:hypothetical protein
VVGGGVIRRGEVGGEGFRDWRVAKGVPEGTTFKEGPAGRMGAGEGGRENQKAQEEAPTNITQMTYEGEAIKEERENEGRKKEREREDGRDGRGGGG